MAAGFVAKGRIMTSMTERPTTSGTEPHSVEELQDVLDEPIVPDGCKAGIIKGNIVSSPWSRGY